MIKKKKNKEVYRKLIKKMCFEIKMKKKQDNLRRRVFSDVLEFRTNRNSIFSFLEKRSNKL